MSRVTAIDEIRVTLQRSEEENSKSYRIEEGVTLGDFLDDLSINATKFTIFVNGSSDVSLSDELKDGDSVRLDPIKYGSGC